MPIASSKISHNSPHSGRLRIRCAYIFTDGRVITRGPMFVANQTAAAVKLLALEPGVAASLQLFDAEQAEQFNLDIANTGEATRQQIARQYLRRAMQEENPFTALNKIRKADNFFTAQGWTVAQIKSQLDINDTSWQKITTRYTYLKSVEQALIDYQIAKAGDTIRIS